MYDTSQIMTTPPRSLVSESVTAGVRPHVRGKFIYVGDKKLYVRGVTYGPFRPDADGNEYQDSEVVERDFAQIVANDMNAVRIPHTTPPRSLSSARSPARASRWPSSRWG